ncbi:hypothetical protein [Streptomyces sp. NPDC050145]|uniref:hypothetical protein n=1 Tax=Streptomyces sp. NPDC050145 TaxID=3365602 RepID=UPI00379B4577
MDESHWDGLPDGTGRRTTTPVPDFAVRPQQGGSCDSPLQNLLNRSAAAQILVSKRPLSLHDGESDAAGECQIRDLATLSFVETKTNVALLGPPVISGA